MNIYVDLLVWEVLWRSFGCLLEVFWQYPGSIFDMFEADVVVPKATTKISGFVRDGMNGPQIRGPNLFLLMSVPHQEVAWSNYTSSHFGFRQQPALTLFEGTVVNRFELLSFF